MLTKSSAPAPVAPAPPTVVRGVSEKSVGDRGGAHPWSTLYKTLYNRDFGRTTRERDQANEPDPATNEPNFVACPRQSLANR